MNEMRFRNKFIEWLALVGIMLMIGHAQGAWTVDSAAANARQYSPAGNDTAFAENAYIWAVQHVNWTYSRTVYVKSPERALREGSGDCSEIALLTAAMLEAEGVDAEVVHGYMADGLHHDSVEVRTGTRPWIVDANRLPGFSPIGYGLFPSEVVVS